MFFSLIRRTVCFMSSIENSRVGGRGRQVKVNISKCWQVLIKIENYMRILSINKFLYMKIIFMNNYMYL